MNYLGYAKSGKEFEVEQSLQALGIAVWCGKLIEWRRVGKKRYPDAFEEPCLPNYIFMDLSPEQFHQAQQVKFLAATMVMLSRADQRNLRSFRGAVDREYATQDQMRQNAQAPKSAFKAGEQLKIISGPFAEKLATFRKVVERSGMIFPRMEIDVEGIRLQVDPLDVKRAG